ncbi:MAG: xanthine dehydrogenase family protein molybdopterin-binding subunit [Bryobacterales bacterium]|nr:xanthine dehydrogenase family protein molybdopterin-binding subunit [Bryobacterales bacterium]
MSRVSFRTLDRRTFLKYTFGTGALILGTHVPGWASEADKATFHPSVFLGIEPDGEVIIVAHRSEMGTGSKSTLPMVVAEELEADWKRVRVEQAIGDEKYGSQNTDGSCSIRDFVEIMQSAGATARTMLELAAAQKWNVSASECKAQNHEVVHAKSGQRAGFGELAPLAAKLPAPDQATLKFKSPGEYRYINKNTPVVDQKDLCEGKGTFGYDAKMPDMLVASIEHSPVYGGTVASFDATEAKKVPGVQHVVAIERFKEPHNFQALGGVAVLADHTWAAMQGRKKLKVNWDSGSNASYDSDRYREQLVATAKQPGKVVANRGDVDAGFAAAAKTLEAVYTTPLLSHAPMEPPAAVAEFKDGKVVCHAATQNPQAVQETVAAAMGIEKKDVICHVTLLGGGFGRKSKPDYVAEAAILSKKVGRPVKVVWSREDDIRTDFYHSPAGMYMKAGLDAAGKPTAWLQRSVFPSIGTTFGDQSGYGMELEMGMGWNDLPYSIPNHRAENGQAKNHIRIGWLRAVANVYHAFAIHSFTDELAHLAGKDPVDYVLGLLGPGQKLEINPVGMKYWNHDQDQQKYPVDTGRLRNVIETVAQKSGWASRTKGNGHGWGFAAHRSFLTYVAIATEVQVERDRVRIPNMHICVDAGQTFHEDRVHSQMEGACVFGTSLAMLSEISVKEGKVVQSNFHNYQVARFTEAPMKVHVHLIKSDAPPAGVGEPGVPPVAPSIANAIFAATGKRLRDLPLRKGLRA